MMPWGTISLGYNLTVIRDEREPAVIGSFRDNNGFVWDRRKMIDENDESTRHMGRVTPQEYNLSEGTVFSDWESGTPGRGLRFKKDTVQRQNQYLTVTPVYGVDSFQIYNEDRYLFSDYSYSDRAESFYATGLGDVSSVDLHEDAMFASIDARIFTRSEDLMSVTWKKFDYVDAFTGILGSGSRVEIDPLLASVSWASVSERHNEFILDEVPATNRIVFNQDACYQVGNDSTASPTPLIGELTYLWEQAGEGIDSGRRIYSKYFPIMQGSSRVVSVSGSGVLTEWTETSSLATSLASDSHFEVNHDLGIIQMGGYKAGDVFLSEDLTPSSTTISVFDTDEFRAYPERGILRIGTERVFYTEKGNGKFLNCTREYLGTPARTADDLRGFVIEIEQQGASTRDTLYVAYKAVPRVEYEITDYTLRTANETPFLDVHPLNQSDDHKIVQIQSATKDLASIKLEIDRASLGGNMYGPIFYGRDTGALTATAYDSHGNEVANQLLNISLVSGPGSIGSGGSTYSAKTNSNGQVQTVYSAGLDGSDALKKTILVSHNGADTEIISSNIPAGTSVGDIWVYHILKQDPFYGEAGLERQTTAVVKQTSGFGMEYFVEVFGHLTDDYNGGYFTWVRGGIPGIAYIQGVEHLTSPNKSRVFTSTNLTSGSPSLFPLDNIYIRKQGAVQWDPSLLNGVPVIVHEYDAAADHPINGPAAGAYVPVHPDSVSGDVLTFSSKNLPLPALAGNIGAYGIVSPGQARLVATGTDPVTGKNIISNEIRVNLELPGYLTGVTELGVPTGYTVGTGETVGSGLGGANFITVNYQSGSSLYGLTITSIFP